MATQNIKSEVLIQILKKAMEITEWFKNHSFKSYTKQDESPVTLADYASQMYIISKIKEFFPKDSIVAEEKIDTIFDKNSLALIRDCYRSLNVDFDEDFKETINYEGSQSDYIWTIDPIDGTLGFQKGLFYAIGIGYMKKGVLLLSAIGVPHYHEKSSAIFFAERGEGAKVCYGNNPFRPIHVSKTDNLEQARIAISLHYNKPWVFDFVRKSGISNSIQIDSMLKFCMIADGTADIYIKPMDMYSSYSWDYLPGNLLVKEAGGKVSDFNKKHVVFENEKCIITSPGIISSNGIIHDKALNLLNQINIS